MGIWLARFILLLSILVFLWATAKFVALNPRMFVGKQKPFLRFYQSVTTSSMRMFAVVIAIAGIMSLALFLIMLVIFNLHIFKYLMVLDITALLAIFVVFFSTSRLHFLVAITCILAVIVSWMMWPNWLTTNALAAIVALSCLCILLRILCNFKLAMMLVSGLFIYDIVNVFFTGNMVKAAHGVLNMSLPLPLLITIPARASLDAPRAGALGAGDIVVPGLLILIASVLAYRYRKMSLLYMGLLGYGVGLTVTFIILEVTQTGQPALLYLFPCGNSRHSVCGLASKPSA